jgi:putative membrane protein
LALTSREEAIEMMWWYGNNGVGGWGFPLMMIGNVLFWVVIIIGLIALIRYLGRGDRTTSGTTLRRTPEELLAERFARGEIDEPEYRQRLDTLRQGPRPYVQP